MKVCGTTKITYQGKEIDLGGEWKKNHNDRCYKRSLWSRFQ